jgi:hypothetical protein
VTVLKDFGFAVPKALLEAEIAGMIVTEKPAETGVLERRTV